MLDEVNFEATSMLEWHDLFNSIMPTAAETPFRTFLHFFRSCDWYSGKSQPETDLMSGLRTAVVS